MLLGVSGSLPADTISLRSLLALIGEQGLLLVCIFLTLPFMIPVSIPGSSTVFGLGIILIGIAATFNRVPWLPRWVLDRPLSTPPLKVALEKGARLVARFERMVRPRWFFLTETTVANYMHGLAMVFAGGLLMLPLGMVPFSNTLPAVAVLLLAFGMLERDGLFLIAGYLMNVATVAYVAILMTGAFMAGQGIMEFLGR